MKITQSERQRFFSAHVIYDCAIRNATNYDFLLLEDVGDIDMAKRRLLNLDIKATSSSRIDATNYFGFPGPVLAATQHPKSQALLVSLNCGVAALGAGDDAMESDIPHGRAESTMATSVHGVTTIDGYAYAVGPWRSVCRRVGVNQWEQVGTRETLPRPAADRHGSTDEGLDAIDGFSARDIYAVGGRGDAWHFNGDRWHRIALPTNKNLENVCCAGDGFVYIGMGGGAILQGRGDRWKEIHDGGLSIAFKDMVWFQDRVWCTSDYGLWTIENGKLIEPDLPASVRACSGNAAAGFGQLLLAGRYGATVYDGTTWTTLIDAT